MSDTLLIAQLPTSHSALLYAVSLFSAPGWQHTERSRYAKNEMRLLGNEKQKGSLERTSDLLRLLRQSLSQDQASTLWGDAVEQLLRLGNSLDALELHTRTYSASPQQALWVLLAFDIAPALGRTWGFWCQDEPLLPRMPEDDLWFLPHQDPASPDRLILPVEAVLTWWLEQVEGPMDRLWGSTMTKEDVPSTTGSLAKQRQRFPRSWNGSVTIKDFRTRAQTKLICQQRSFARYCFGRARLRKPTRILLTT